jgi:ankyrin repeat protein
VPLSWAVQIKDREFLKILWDARKIVNSNGPDIPTLLLDAGRNGHAEIMESLLVYSDNIELDSVRDSLDGILEEVAQDWNVEIVQLLLDHRIFLNLKENSRAYLSHQLLFPAVKSRRKAVVKLLLDAYILNVDQKDTSGQTSLSQAAQNGHEDIVTLLLDTGKVDLNSQDDSGRTPLSHAAGNGHAIIVILLLCSPEVQVRLPDQTGRSPFLARSTERTWKDRGVPRETTDP